MRSLGLVVLAALTVVAVASSDAQMGQRPSRPIPGQGPMGPGMGPRGGPMGTGVAPWANLRGQSHEPFIDTHTHLDGIVPGGSDWEGAVQAALAGMQALGVTKSLVMPPPYPANHPRRYDHEAFVTAVARHPDKLGFLSGGGSLNGMIQEAIAAGTVTDALRARFEERAEQIVRDGALGFGEMTAEHLSFAAHHPYEAAPPDHPLFLLLADVAARHDVPIDLHMEAVVRDIPLPPRFSAPPNPTTLKENIAGLERLLAHNRKAKILWVHAGWDNTGHGTAALLRRLLEAHPNLYLSVKIDQMSLADTRPLDSGGLRRDWRELVRSFADRFVVGTDRFYASPRFPMARPVIGDGVRPFLDQLPADLARRIGTENAVRLYNLMSAK